jgi:hypothetical protein
MTRKQENLWYSGELVDALNALTTADSKQRGGWRRWDVDIKLNDEGPEWQGMLDASRQLLSQPAAPKLPVIVIFRGKVGKVYPFPEDDATLKNLLKK